MRILTLSLAFLSLFYYFWPSQKTQVEIDAIKVQVSAPERPARSVAMREPVAQKKSINRQGREELAEVEPAMSSTPEQNLEHYEEVPVNEIEKEWHEQLAETLSILEPQHGPVMFEAFMQEKESFQVELDTLIRNNQKSYDLEYLIEDLEFKHEERIKEIFGAYYEELKFQEGKYMESLSSNDGYPYP
jgi:hypothetical protein